MKLRYLLRQKAEEGLGACISYPKSGRTWLRVMLDELGVPLEYAHGGSAFHQDRFRKPTHFLGRRKRVLFLHRDPIDTTVSGYFQVTKREAWRGLFEGTISEFVRSPLGISRTLSFNSMWLKAASDETALVSTYEALHHDPAAELRRICHWFGISPDDTQLAGAKQAGNFETMKAKEASGGYESSYDHRLRPADAADPNSFKVRRGVVGGYRQYLSEEDVEFCNNAIGREARSML